MEYTVQHPCCYLSDDNDDQFKNGKDFYSVGTRTPSIRIIFSLLPTALCVCTTEQLADARSWLLEILN